MKRREHKRMVINCPHRVGQMFCNKEPGYKTQYAFCQRPCNAYFENCPTNIKAAQEVNHE